MSVYWKWVGRVIFCVGVGGFLWGVVGAMKSKNVVAPVEEGCENPCIRVFITGGDLKSVRKKSFCFGLVFRSFEKGARLLRSIKIKDPVVLDFSLLGEPVDLDDENLERLQFVLKKFEKNNVKGMSVAGLTFSRASAVIDIMPTRLVSKIICLEHDFKLWPDLFCHHMYQLGSVKIIKGMNKAVGNGKFSLKTLFLSDCPYNVVSDFVRENELAGLSYLVVNGVQLEEFCEFADDFVLLKNLRCFEMSGMDWNVELIGRRLMGVCKKLDYEFVYGHSSFGPKILERVYFRNFKNFAVDCFPSSPSDFDTVEVISFLNFGREDIGNAIKLLGKLSSLKLLLLPKSSEKWFAEETLPDCGFVIKFFK